MPAREPRALSACGRIPEVQRVAGRRGQRLPVCCERDAGHWLLGITVELDATSDIPVPEVVSAGDQSLAIRCEGEPGGVVHVVEAPVKRAAGHVPEADARERQPRGEQLAVGRELRRDFPGIR